MAYDAAFIVVEEWGFSAPIVIAWNTLEEARQSRERCITQAEYWSRVTIHKHCASGIYEIINDETKINDSRNA